MPHCKHRKRNTIPKWQFLPVGRIYPAKVAAFRANLALPFAKRGECASCENAQHLPCQHSRKVIRSGDIRPAFALPIPSRYAPRYRIAILPAVSPLPARLRASCGQPRALFRYRLFRILSCYSVARHNINGLRKLGNARHGRRLVLLRLAAVRTRPSMAGNAPCQAGQAEG